MAEVWSNPNPAVRRAKILDEKGKNVTECCRKALILQGQ
nr:MAG TPA: hypothetical protein [Caudoviricetes sp.]